MTFALTISAWAEPDVSRFSNTDELPAMGANPLSGVPDYHWWYGCSPTAGGMIIGYWDSHPSGNWSNLVEGNISTQNTTANTMIASPEHILDYWGDPDPMLSGHADNCIADFMHTSRAEDGLGDGGTWGDMIPTGLHDYAYWDNPTTATNEAYNSDSWNDDVGYWGGPFTWEAYKSEIDAGNPMVLDVVTYAPGLGGVGHSVVGYGYQDEMFDLQIPSLSGLLNITVGGFAVWDTWNTTSSQSYWRGWDASTISSQLIDGVEWWPFLDMTQTDGYSFTGYWDWQVVEGIYFHPGAQVPLPSTILLLAMGLLGIVAQRRRSLIP